MNLVAFSQICIHEKLKSGLVWEEGRRKKREERRRGDFMPVYADKQIKRRLSTFDIYIVNFG